MKPWTPVVLEDRAVSCWGRTYGYESSVLPSRIVTQRENILTGPVGIAAVVGGRKLKWGRASFKPLGFDPGSARYVTTASCDKLSVECRFETEFDGVTRADLTVTPKGQVKLDSLDVAFPLKPECATLFHHEAVGQVDAWDWPRKQMNAGALTPDGLKLPFVHFIWVGNDDVGLQLFSETDEALAPADTGAAVTVTPGRKTTVFRISLLSNVALNRPWKWTFGFVASPVKPYWTEHYTTHYCQNATYGQEKRPPDGGACGLDHLEAAGVDYAGFHENWSDEQSLPRPKNPEELRSLIKGFHERGIGLVLYTGSFMPTRSSGFNMDWRSIPIDKLFVYERADNHDKCYYMCPNTGFADLLLRAYEQAFKDYGFDGLYMDGPPASLPCENTKHGCGYVGADGKVHATMPIWKPRETMKRFRRLVKSQPRPCIIVGHTSASIILPILSFVDVYLDGEHLLGWRKLGTDEYPEGILRAEMSGHNFGIPAIQLPLRGTEPEADRERARTVCLLHDVTMEWGYGDAADIWRAWDRFGVAGSRWVGYWRSSGLADVEGEGIRVSAYLHKGRGALFVVGNLGQTEQRAVLRPNRKALGVAPQVPLKARDGCSDEKIEVQAGSVAVDVKPGRFRMVSVQGG